MANTTLIICSVISIITAILIIYIPLFVNPTTPYFISGETGFDESLAILETIDELESDFKMGKLSQDDYDAMTLEYQRRYLALKEK